jgi:PPP family 3-phenylpropionic acid transporter
LAGGMLEWSSWLTQVFLFAGLVLFRAGFLSLVPVGVLANLGPKAAEEYGQWRRIGSIGFLVGSIGTGYLIEWTSPHAILWVMILGAAIPAWIYRKPRGYPSQQSQTLSPWQALKHPPLKLLVAAHLLISIWSSAAFLLLPVRMRELDASASLIAWTISLCGIIAVLTLVPVAKWVDRHNAAKIYPIVAIAAALRVGLMAWPSVQPEWFLFIQLFHVPTWVLGEVLQIRLLRTLCSTEHLAAGQAWILGALNGGIALAGLVVGLLELWDWSLQESFLVLAWIPLLALFPLWKLRKEKPISITPHL